MATEFAANTETLYALSDLHGRIAAFYKKTYNQTIEHANAVIKELHNAQRYDSLAKYEAWKEHLSRLQDEMNTHAAWSDYFGTLAHQLDVAENGLH